MARLDQRIYEVLGEQLIPPPPPPAPKNTLSDDTWSPRQTPTQNKLFHSKAKFILCWSEKGPGKTWGALDKLVRHCYENENALALILVRVRSMANKGGAWDKLQNNILPAWRDGNRDRDGNLLDEGLGLNYSEGKYDSQHNEFMWIQNKFGGWSMVVLVSCPHANQLRDRIRGYEPSYVFVDELTSCDSPIYFTSVAAQLGRRPFIKGPQQFVAACNPDDPEHWVYQTWFVNAFNEETGEWDPDYENIYFPIDENMGNLVEGYIDSLKKIYRDDPIEAARMIGGEWVAKPAGNALFKDIYNPAVHCYPVTETGAPDVTQSLLPVKGYSMIIGLDPGTVNNGFVFEQYLPINQKMKWLIFDEIVTIQKRINYRTYIPIVMRRIAWWRKEMGFTAADMPQVWISDNSAFNQFRSAGGSYDVLEIEKIYEENRAALGLEPMKVKQCPKFSGSDIAQTQIGQRILGQDEIVISSGRCPKVQKMFLQLATKAQKPGEPFDPTAALTPARSPHLHVWKALSYPMLMASLNPMALVPMNNSTQSLTRIGG